MAQPADRETRNHVKIDCSNCLRSFEVDEERTKNIAALQCLCGNRLALNPGGFGAAQKLGKYVLINRIAVGGMGEIFYGKVSGVEGFEKEVAIKKMLPHLSADRDFINMMIKEAKLTVLLNHPNIVGIQDLAKEGDEYYIAMEYVPGVTVGAILEQARKQNIILPLEVPVHIILQVLRGLAYAHNLTTPSGERLAILHRDITPQNILVTRKTFVKITDFGIAKAVNEISTTSPGMIKGKLGYIAPEQLEGKEADQRVDLFCAGILLWEMFAIRRLFKGATEMDTFRLIADCKIPSLTQYRDDITANLAAVINRALAKNLDQRYPRAEDFYAALTQAISPRTPDDFSEATEIFFSNHPEFFASVDAHKGAAPENNDVEHTRVPSSNKLAPGNEQPLESIDKYLHQAPKKRPSGAKWIALVGASLMIIAAGGVAVFRYLAPAPPAHKVSTTAPENLNVTTVKPLAPKDISVAPPAVNPIPPPAPPAARRDVPVERPLKLLSGPEIQATVMRYQSEVAHCLKDLDTTRAPSKVDARIAIDMSGRVTSVEFNPPLEKAAVDQCLSRSLKSMHFRKHPSRDLKVTIPLKIQVM